MQFLVIAAILMIYLLGIVLVFLRYKELILSTCREPVLAFPVVVFESDDWGPGGDSHVKSLLRIRSILESHVNSRDENPVMTISTNLYAPVNVDISGGGFSEVSINDDVFFNIKKILLNGDSSGIMPMQMHGDRHYRKAVLSEYINDNNDFLSSYSNNEIINTEDLPAHVQTRWNTSSEDYHDRSAQEVLNFYFSFKFIPKVAVAPTFVWNESVEEGWVSAGVTTVITPGCRNVSRNTNGFVVDRDYIFNGKMSRGIVYLVRNCYFEPYKFVGPDQCIHQIIKSINCGRPSIVETHRWNYINPDEISKDRAFFEFNDLVQNIIKRIPDVRFMSSEKLSELYRARGDNELYFIKNIFCVFVKVVLRLNSLNISIWIKWFSGIKIISILVSVFPNFFDCKYHD